MANYTLLAYIFFVSWTSAFALNSWLRLHFLVAFVALISAFMMIAVRGRYCFAPYKVEDSLVGFFLMTYVLAALINPNVSSLNYVLIYVWVLIGLFLLMKGALFAFLSSRQIYMANLCGVAFVGGFLTVNFILMNVGIADLQAMIPRLRETTATYAGMYVRGYGFSTEPGIVIYYLNTLGPLALWFMWSGVAISRLVKFVITSLIVFGWIVTFSAGGVFALVISLLVTSFFIIIKTKFLYFAYRNFPKLIIIIPIFLTVIFSTNYTDINSLLSPLYEKLTFSDNLSTATTRLARYETSYSIIKESPIFGNGPGYYASMEEGSTINWYLMILSESGILSIFPILIFLFIVMIRIIRYQHPSRLPIFFGFIAACAHLMVTTTAGYLHPFIWLLIAIFYVQMALHRKYKNSLYLQRTNFYSS